MTERQGQPLELGGIRSDVEIIVKDTQSDPKRAADVTADLILRTTST